MKKTEEKWIDASRFRADPAVMDHDPEDSVREGMSDDAAGAATGLGVDRGESAGAGGLAAGEDLDPAAAGDYWRQNYRRRPWYRAGKPYEYYEPGYRFGWEIAADLEFQDRNFSDVETELARRWEARRPPDGPGWPDAAGAARDAFERRRGGTPA